jgi:hypothetical protein
MDHPWAHIKFAASFVDWIDFDGKTQLIQIWLVNGSNVSLIPKPNKSPLFNVHLTTHYKMVILGEILVWCVSSWHFTLACKSQYNIVIGLVVALHYLHEEWGRCILHCDVKASYVMLDANSKAHLRDFALARLIDHDKLPKITLITSTLGYLAPKLWQTKKTTTKSNVYNFGNYMWKMCL